MNALKKRHLLAQREAAKLLAQCRQQIAHLKGDMAASAQKTPQERKAAPQTAAVAAFGLHADDMPVVREWWATDDFADTVQYVSNPHCFVDTVMESDFPARGHGFADTVVEDARAQPALLSRMKPSTMAHYA